MTLMAPARLNKAALRRPELRLGSIARHFPALPRQDFVADACRQADFMRRFDGRAVRERTDRKPPLPFGLGS
jgi:hypothetical protein